jgi:hypothetical protein
MQGLQDQMLAVFMLLVIFEPLDFTLIFAMKLGFLKTVHYQESMEMNRKTI